MAYGKTTLACLVGILLLLLPMASHASDPPLRYRISLTLSNDTSGSVAVGIDKSGNLQIVPSRDFDGTIGDVHVSTLEPSADESQDTSMYFANPGHWEVGNPTQAKPPYINLRKQAPDPSDIHVVNSGTVGIGGPASPGPPGVPIPPNPFTLPLIMTVVGLAVILFLMFRAVFPKRPTKSPQERLGS